MRCVLFSILALGFFVTLSQARAAEFRSGDKVTIAAEESIDDDLYVFGGEIVIDGDVDGDVCAFGRQITINGTVTGNVMAAGQTVVIMGQAGTARIAGQVLRIDSTAKLTGDLLAAGLSLECQKGSDVVGDALFAGYQALFAGNLGSDLKASLNNCRLDGSFGGDVSVKVGGDRSTPSPNTFGQAPPVEMPDVPGGLTVSNSAEIKGDLDYEGQSKADIDPNANIEGEVNFHEKMLVEKEDGKAAAASGVSKAIFNRVRHILSVSLVGLVVLLLFPQWTATWADTIRHRPVASFFSGLIGLFVFLAACLFLLIFISLVALIFFGIRITELGPLVLVGGMVGYAGLLVAFWIVTSFLAEALTGMTIGRLAVSGDSVGGRLGAMFVGVILIGIVLSVPVLGWLVGFVIMLFGLGSICLWLIGQSPTPTTPLANPVAAAA